MAMPSPASDSMEMDCAIMAGISTCHLQNKTRNISRMRKIYCSLFIRKTKRFFIKKEGKKKNNKTKTITDSEN